jgi:hypothetical protein
MMTRNGNEFSPRCPLHSRKQTFGGTLGTSVEWWAVADTEQASKNNALSNCQATAGPTRQNACKITDSYCDGSAKSNSK